MSLWEDYAYFHEAQTLSRDMDPMYPILGWFAKDLERDRSLWLTFLFVAYYHLGSALAVFEEYPAPSVPKEFWLKAPISQPRRGHRDSLKLAKHLSSLCAKAEKHGGLGAWLDSVTQFADPITNWKSLNEELMTVFGNGRWAAYKTAEILYKSHGFNLEAPDMGHANSSGPRKGLALFFPGLPLGNSPAEIAQLDNLSLKIVDYLQDKTSQVSIETAETSLCDFNALVKGKYYVGIDIDEMQEQLFAQPCLLADLAFTARSEVLPNQYLGELNGWTGIDKSRKTIYRQTRQIVLRG
jgi:hypothetical protein